MMMTQEEFLVVLPNCDLEQAHQQAERMRIKLQESPMVVDGAELTVSASFGVTVSDGSEKAHPPVQRRPSRAQNIR